MEISMAPGTEVLPLTCLMLLLLCRAPGAGAQGGQDFKLHQPQDKVSVKAGETLTLNCTVSGFFEAGPVKWLKGWGTGSKTIYEDTSFIPSRVMTALNGSNTDFTIYIRDVQPEDVGTYYCVKFRKTLSGGNEVLQRGNGTEVSVLVFPSVDVSADQTSPIEVNKTMKFTCHVKGFYPENVAVSWLENGVKIKEEKDSRPSVFCQGLFELRSQLEVQATEEKNGSMFTCMVVHDAQALVNQSSILWIASPDQEGPSVNLLSSLLLLWLGMLLEKGILGGLLFFLFKHTKRETLGTLPCPAPFQSSVPQGGSQGLATTSRVL